MQKITTFLTFEKNGKKAVDFYASIFKDSNIDHTMVMPGTDQLLHAGFSLNGQNFMAMDGGDISNFKFTDGISLFVACEDQSEVDYFWEKLGEGGEYSRCGWLKDKFGVSWQIIPNRLGELMVDSDQTKAGKVMQAMLKMDKIIIADLESASK